MEKSILVVDDEPAIRKLLKIYLGNAGYQVTDVKSVREARLALQGQMFDLVITDINMPEETGIELIKHINESQLEIGIVVVTVLDNPIEAREIFNADVYGYIVKPFSENLVIITVENALRRHYLETLEQSWRRDLESRLRTIIDHLYIGLMLIEPDLAITETNLTILKWFPAIEKSGKVSFLNNYLVSSEDDRSSEQQLTELFEAKTPYQFQARYLTSEGERDFQVAMLPVLSDLGTCTAAILMFDDWTEKLNLERELRQAQKLEAIGQLAAGVAHEINSPIQYIGDNIRFFSDAFTDLKNIIEGCTEIHSQLSDTSAQDAAQKFAQLKSQADYSFHAEEIPKSVDQSLDGIHRVSSIIQALREFSHPGTSEMENININKCLQSTITVSRNEWKYVATLVSEFNPDLPMVPALQGELNQAFLNLIINAAHAIKDKIDTGELEKGEIRVSTDLGPGCVVIAIKDNGGGIPDGIQARIFDPFFTTKPVGQGTGQGLAITRSIIVDKHHGKLTFKVVPGKSTTFFIKIPLDTMN